jgi:hypothetical protein
MQHYEALMHSLKPKSTGRHSTLARLLTLVCVSAMRYESAPSAMKRESSPSNEICMALTQTLHGASSSANPFPHQSMRASVRQQYALLCSVRVHQSSSYTDSRDSDNGFPAVPAAARHNTAVCSVRVHQSPAARHNPAVHPTPSPQL